MFLKNHILKYFFCYNVTTNLTRTYYYLNLNYSMGKINRKTELLKQLLGYVIKLK